ncbi:MAG TPA: uridine kinase [Bacteroidales bacterium]|nr:uridine kinase [Bacteroidales bacterium]
MLGDILLINDMHKNAAEDIFKVVMKNLEKKNNRYRYIVGISGESGSGKSELAHSLGKRLKEENIRVKVIHTDNYYKIQPLLREEWRRNKGFDRIGIDEYDWVKIRKTIRDFREEQECVIPCIDLIPEQVDKLITDFGKIDLLVIDGLYAIDATDIDLRVFIDLTYQETKINQIIRLKEELSTFRLKILDREHQAVASLKPKADLIVNKAYQVVTAEGQKRVDN